MDGLTHDELAMHAPSVTNRLGTSCAWLCALRTDVLGSRPIRAVPISWIPIPGQYPLSYVRTSFTPAASSISAMSFIMSLRIRRSFSPVAQSIASTGSPHLSFLFGSIVTRFAGLGSISPNAVPPIDHDPGCAAASLNAAPTPSSATARDHPERLAPPWYPKPREYSRLSPNRLR